MSVAAHARQLSPDLLAAHIDRRFKNYRHSRLIAVEIIDGITDPNIDCVIVRTPPRVGKSTMVNWCIIWLLDWFPWLPLISIAYGVDLANRNSRTIRNWFQVAQHKLRTRLAPDSQGVTEWATTEGGGLKASGISSVITGYDAGHIFIDDPHKSWAEAQSQRMRDKVWEAFESDIESRRTIYHVGGQQTYPTIVIVATPMHPDDLSHRAQAKYSAMVDPDTGETENRCKLIHIPALCDPEIVWPDLLDRQPGESICEDMLPAKELRRRRDNMNVHMFNALYQGVCRVLTGGLVERSWWAWARQAPSPEDRIVTFTSWDLTFKKTGKSWVVGQLWCITKSSVDPSYYNLYLLDQVRRKAGFTDQHLLIRGMAEQHPEARFHLIEDKANGSAVIDSLKLAYVDTTPRDETGRRVEAVRGHTAREKRWPPLEGIVPIEPKGDKVTRLQNCTPMIRGGRVLLPSWWTPRTPEQEGWKPRYPGDPGDLEPSAEAFAGLINECADIPNSATDDIADCLSQACDWSRSYMGSVQVESGQRRQVSYRTKPKAKRRRRRR